MEHDIEPYEATGTFETLQPSRAERFFRILVSAATLSLAWATALLMVS